MRTLLPIIVLATVAFGTAPAPVERDELFAVVLFNRQHVIGATSLRSGIFHSTNGGESWEHLGWENIRAFGLAVDGSGEHRRMILAAGNGLLRSTDAGDHWRITTDWRVAEVLRTAIDPIDPQWCYATSAHGFLRSSDGGATWEYANNGLRGTFASTLLLIRDTILIGSDVGLYRSVDRGTHWDAIANDVLKKTGVLDIERMSDGSLLAGTEDLGVWRSLDRGATWRNPVEGLPRNAWYSIAGAAGDPQIAYAAGFESGVWRTTNAGASWQRAGDTLAGRSFHALATSPRDANVVYAGEYNGGIWKSTDAGASWKFVGLEGSQVWEVLVR
jgi:photosystem II stability/assembly factor-like uncharacterized protein